jgi:hypothetical protein
MRDSFRQGSKLVRLQLSHWSRLRRWGAIVAATLKAFGPYAAIELLLPGGSVIALSLWFYRRRKRAPVLAESLNAL